jgi:hydroxypyruvate reductase
LGAASLDVFFDEPQVPDALLSLGNLVLTPHIASATDEAMSPMGPRSPMGQCVIDNLTSRFDGTGALTAVAQVWLG